jgi:hypothetical protein
MQRDVNITIWDPHKGMVNEKDLKHIVINGKLYASDDQPTRKLFSHGPNSFAITINPRFVDVLCPFQEKHVKQELIKEENGQYLLTIRGVQDHE